MLWDDFYGHSTVIDAFRRRLQLKRLASTFLFVGPAGVGKATFATRLAQALLCETVAEEQLDACGQCSACTQLLAGSHPDMLTVARPKDRAFIPLEAFIGERDKRMRDGLIHHLSLKPFQGGRKIALIDDADLLNEEGANSLLKTLEEPPPMSVLILVGTSEQKQLPTIRSRSQVVRFGPLSNDDVAKILLQKELVGGPAEASQLAALSAGSVRRALEWQVPGFVEFRQDLMKLLARPPWPAVKLSKLVQGFVDSAGKEAPAKRQRFLVVMDVVAGFLRGLLRSLADADADAELDGDVTSCASRWSFGADAALNCIDRCADSELQLQRNANIAGLIECWCDDLSRLADGDAAC